MPAACPTCQIPLPAGPAVSRCPNCGAIVAEPGARPPVGAICAHHHSNPAEAVCERCGDFVCRLCLTPIEGRGYCPRCFDLLYHRGALEFSRRDFVLPAVTLTLGISSALVGLFCPFVNVFLSIPMSAAGIWCGVKSLREIAGRPELPGENSARWGIGLSIAGVVVTLVWTGLFVWLFRS